MWFHMGVHVRFLSVAWILFIARNVIILRVPLCMQLLQNKITEIGFSTAFYEIIVIHFVLD